MSYIGETSHFYSANETYLLQLYQRYLDNPSLIDAEWVKFFEEYSEEFKENIFHGNDFKGPSWANRETSVIGATALGQSFSDSLSDDKKNIATFDDLVALVNRASSHGGVENSRQAVLDSVRAIMLIRGYRNQGHLLADLDPLNINQRQRTDSLHISRYGFDESDLDREVFINYFLGLETATLGQIVDICQKTYCGKIGYEYNYIQNVEERLWLQQQIESPSALGDISIMGKKAIYDSILGADSFENFLDTKFRGTKRFGLDGGEAVVPMIEQIIKRGAFLGVEDIVFGMAHRGRLNVLANVMSKPYYVIFSEFGGKIKTDEDMNYSGDVKYHLGASSDREFNGKKVHLSLVPNPSHLECVNTVVLGKVRAKQDQLGDSKREKVMGVLLHGDAAFIGQGIVAETFLLSQLDGYKTGGTVHIAINNQIGFTTAPSQSRSSPYCSDMAKIIDAPVFHVNGDDPEACIRTARLAMEYRQKFQKDVVIDVWCYRRHGHNESDEPKFTQPKMYQRIAQHPRTIDLYEETLIAQNVLTADEAKKSRTQIKEYLASEYEKSVDYQPNDLDWLGGQWQGLSVADEGKRRGATAISKDLLQEIGHKICQIPANFNAHARIQKQLQDKLKVLESGKGFDWGFAEALAIGSLLCESSSVRLSGEDSQRGTFSHRHAVLIDQENEDQYVPLNNIRLGQASLEVLDSPLSEFGLLGFEYGYAGAEPHSLIIWEAQFGDFANGAQVIIDQFIASGEAKWLRMNGLVMLLPHGFEGQGPEHSSARLERYLQLSAEDNWQVCNITDPANYFHALRRQIRRNFRKPLIQMSPKSLLRHKKCVSNIESFTDGSSFHRVLYDDGEWAKTINAPNKIKRLVLCSGKVYFDLLEERDKRGIKDIYLMRVEQLYPFPDDVLGEELQRFTNAEVVWCQEEPENMGAWSFVVRIIEKILRDNNHKPNQHVDFYGRRAAASPATGSAKRHIEEQQKIINDVLTITTKRK